MSAFEKCEICGAIAEAGTWGKCFCDEENLDDAYSADELNAADAQMDAASAAAPEGGEEGT